MTKNALSHCYMVTVVGLSGEVVCPTIFSQQC